MTTKRTNGCGCGDGDCQTCFPKHDQTRTVHIVGLTGVWLTVCESMVAALQHADASGETPIAVENIRGVRYATIAENELNREDVQRMVAFAYITFHEPSGRIMCVPASGGVN